MQKKSGLSPPNTITGEKLMAVVEVEAAVLQVSFLLSLRLAASSFFPPEDGRDGSDPYDLLGCYIQLGESSRGETTLLWGRR